MDPGDLDVRATICELAQERGSAGEVLPDQSWKEVESMFLAHVRPGFNNRAVNTTERTAAEIEVVFEGWQRKCAVPGRRLVAEGTTYTITRVDPVHGRMWMRIYCSIVR